MDAERAAFWEGFLDGYVKWTIRLSPLWIPIGLYAWYRYGW